MSVNENTTLSHLYGIAGVVSGVVGIVAAIKSDAPWSQYALVLSGWFAAVLYAAMLVKCFNQSRADGERIGDLQGQLRQVQATLDARNATLDYVVASRPPKAAATPRAAPAPSTAAPTTQPGKTP